MEDQDSIGQISSAACGQGEVDCEVVAAASGDQDGAVPEDQWEFEQGSDNNVREGQEEQDPVEDMEEPQEECTWRGAPLDSLIPAVPMCELPLVRQGCVHEVHYDLRNLKDGCPPRSYPHGMEDYRSSEVVHMPYSRCDKHPVRGAPGKLQIRWDVITKALNEEIRTSVQLEKAILSYNHKHKGWDFSLLHTFIKHEMTRNEAHVFFTWVLPGIIKLALRLPELVTRSPSLNMEGDKWSMSLSQQQISCLLANAFLCTFPHRNGDKQFETYPTINFSPLFMKNSGRPEQVSLEKLKCLLNYFRRVIEKPPLGVVTFSRRVFNSTVTWSESKMPIRLLHVDSEGTIEDDGKFMLQVDFANRYVGGGVIGTGCVQEEIWFLICPELIVSRLFVERLADHEALVICGAERYSKYRGYAGTFEFSGNKLDNTPRDASRRICCSIVAIDAQMYGARNKQFSEEQMNRELKKAFAGFNMCEPQDGPVSDRRLPVATGNWGCGAFKGNKWLKAVLQLLAASEAKRDVAYFTFGDCDLRDQLASLHTLFRQRELTVGDVYRALLEFSEGYLRNDEPAYPLFKFLEAKFTPGAALPPKPASFQADKNKWAKAKFGFSGRVGGNPQEHQPQTRSREQPSTSNSKKKIGWRDMVSQKPTTSKDVLAKEDVLTCINEIDAEEQEEASSSQGTSHKSQTPSVKSETETPAGKFYSLAGKSETSTHQKSVPPNFKSATPSVKSETAAGKLYSHSPADKPETPTPRKSETPTFMSKTFKLESPCANSTALDSETIKEDVINPPDSTRPNPSSSGQVRSYADAAKPKPPKGKSAVTGKDSVASLLEPATSGGSSKDSALTTYTYPPKLTKSQNSSKQVDPVLYPQK